MVDMERRLRLSFGVLSHVSMAIIELKIAVTPSYFQGPGFFQDFRWVEMAPDVTAPTELQIIVAQITSNAEGKHCEKEEAIYE